MLMSCGPHHSIIGNRLPRQMLTAVRRLCGHLSIGPIGVFDQSSPRMRAAMSQSLALPALTDSDDVRESKFGHSATGVSAPAIPDVRSAGLTNRKSIGEAESGERCIQRVNRPRRLLVGVIGL